MAYNITRRLAHWLRIERDIRHLRWFDDRLLADLGIERDHIPDLVKGRCDR